MFSKVPEFERYMTQAEAGDEFAERFVRNMVACTAKDMPLPCLLRVGQLIADYRKAEIKQQAEGN